MKHPNNVPQLRDEVYQASLLKIAQRCRTDLFYLCKYILDYNLMEEAVHGDVCEYAQTLLPSHQPDYVGPEGTEGTGMEDQFKAGNSNLLLLLPRGTFKSSVVTIGFTLQVLLNDPNWRILIDSETYGKSKAFFSEVKGHLEANEAFREVFRAIHGVYPDDGKKKNMLWSDAQLNLAARTRMTKEPNISCGAIDHSVNGMHYDLIICDDLHSEKNVTNADQIQQVIDHWKLAYSLLDPGRPMIVIGTRWDYNDLYQHILDEHRDSFNILVRRAIRRDGTLLFPERLTQAFLDDVKKKQGSRIFSAQYQNEPVDDETATFKRSSIVRREWEMVKDRPINWYMLVDPSFKGEYSDFAAIVVAGMDYQRDLYVRHVLRKKMTYADIIDQIFELNATYHPKAIAMKIVAAGGKSLMYELNNEQRRRGVWLPIRELHDSKNKEDRIRGLAPFYEFNHAFHVKECPQLLELEDEMIHFPRGKHDDVLDAYASILEVATPPNPGKNVHKDDKPSHRSLFKPRSPVTGA